MFVLTGECETSGQARELIEELLFEDREYVPLCARPDEELEANPQS